MKPTAIFIIVMLLSSLAVADEKVKKLVRVSFDQNVEFTREEDLEGVLSTIHSQSLSYLATQNILLQLFDVYKLKYEILDYQFIAYDGELAYIKLTQRTSKVSGPAFQDNELDIVQVYKQEAGVWKIWSQANMAIKYLN